MAAQQEQNGPATAGEDHGPRIRVKYLNSNETAAFSAAWATTLAEVWEEAYNKLGEDRKPIDTLEVDDGKVGDPDLGPYLGYTLEQLREAKVAPARHFAIRSDTGGA